MSKAIDKMFDRTLETFVDRLDASSFRIAGTLIEEIDEIKKLMALMIKEQRKTNELLARKRY